MFYPVVEKPDAIESIINAAGFTTALRVTLVEAHGYVAIEKMHDFRQIHTCPNLLRSI